MYPVPNVFGPCNPTNPFNHIWNPAINHAWKPLPHLPLPFSAGGYGADWGIRYDADGQLLTPREDRGPLFQGPEGQAALRAAVLEYAPLWQVGAGRHVCVGVGCRGSRGSGAVLW